MRNAYLKFMVKRFALIALMIAPLALAGQDPCDLQNFRGEIKDDLSVLSSKQDISGSSNPRFEPSEDPYVRFERFSKVITTDELIELFHCENEVLRAYAIWAALLKDEMDLFSLVKDNLMDTTSLQYYESCLHYDFTLGDFMFHQLHEIEKDRAEQVLTDTQWRIVDSILVYGNSPISEQNEALLRLPQSQRNYEYCREIVRSDFRGEALVHIASYQNSKDLPLIRELIDSCTILNQIKILNTYPHPTFTAHLISLQEGFEEYCLSETELILQTLLKYEDSASNQILHGVIDNLVWDSYNYPPMFKALESDSNTSHNAIKWFLWERTQIYSERIFNQLKEEDDKRASELLLKSVEYALFDPEYPAMDFDSMRMTEDHGTDFSIYSLLDAAYVNDSGSTVTMVDTYFQKVESNVNENYDFVITPEVFRFLVNSDLKLFDDRMVFLMENLEDPLYAHQLARELSNSSNQRLSNEAKKFLMYEED